MSNPFVFVRLAAAIYRLFTRPPRAASEGEDEGPPGLGFTRNFPQDPALERLVFLFDQGNYALVRKDAPALIKSSEDPEVRAAAQQLLKRLEPDPLALYLLGIAAALLVVLAGWYWTHPPEGAPPPSAPAVGPVVAPS